MRQPKFLRHLVEKFLLKGQEANANLYPGILPVWDTQPLGVTRLPEVPCKIFQRAAKGVNVDLEGFQLTEPVTFTQTEQFPVGDMSEVIFTNIPVGAILRWKVQVSLELGGLTGPITWEMSFEIAGVAGPIYLLGGRFNADCTCPQFLDTGWLFSQHAAAIKLRTVDVNPVNQEMIFHSVLCLYPNRELC